ncbi:carbon starvation CstA family protein [Anaerovibrio lipolyticus]|uniref:carbon starvation CstA family protein n=1 Tax=Anaerovibrio lipolyticus TaxID=82374 RepID=UPI0023F3377D|nr:carbon starvation CstA family protein [Anaerovibrio lipolyticus]
MITFLCAIATLLLGYIIYGSFVERIFKPTNATTPAVLHNDGVDYIPLPKWKNFLIQVLNIAGPGPIFGALAGAIWGPVVYVWIVLGTIFAGGVHDYLSGMISIREDGKSIAEIVGHHLGKTMLLIMRIFSVVLLILVGTVAMTGPVGLLAKLLGDATTIILPCILLYYFLATLLPIDTLIARFYPILGACLIIMAMGIMSGMLLGVGGHTMPEIQFANLHPKGDAMPIWPLMFITVACGAISGFHSTQSPIIARCLKNEHWGRPIFYGAMVTEGIIALIWAAAGVTFYDNTLNLATAMSENGPAGVVYDICVGFMGGHDNAIGYVASTIAMLGAIACPITSGDTAFRSARLTLADWFNINQSKFSNRIIFAVPLLTIGAIFSQINFDIIWRYFSWVNQTLAMIVLWTSATYLFQMEKGRKVWLIAAIPATFMSAVTFTYILQAKEGFQLGIDICYPAGIIFAIVCAGLFLRKVYLEKSD